MYCHFWALAHFPIKSRLIARWLPAGDATKWWANVFGKNWDALLKSKHSHLLFWFLKKNVYFRNRMSEVEIRKCQLDPQTLAISKIILWMVATFPPSKGWLKTCKSWKVYHLSILSAGPGSTCSSWSSGAPAAVKVSFYSAKFQGLCESYEKSLEGYEEIPEKVWRLGYMMIIDGI